MSFGLFLLVANPAVTSASVSYQYEEYRALIGRQAVEARRLKMKTPQIGIVSHHLPTASPLIDDFYRHLKKARPDIGTFIVVGPDHFEKCRHKFSVSGQSVSTMFGEIKNDSNIFSQLSIAGAKKEDACFQGEHAIGVQANYIRKYFPEARIVPLLLSYLAQSRNFDKTIAVLKKNRKNTFVLASLDFTHYIDARAANINDEVSHKLLLSQDGPAFTLKQVDSPGTLRLVLRLARELKLNTEILDHKNSFDYNGSFQNTTSYFSVLFGK